MIITRIQGGLGNQLFQYAAAYALAKKNNDTLLIDPSWFDITTGGHTKRTYTLNHYPIDTGFANAKTASRIHYPHGKISYFLEKFKLKVLREANINYDKNFFEKSGDTYLNGYYQSEKYFSHIKEEVIRLFTPKTELTQTTIGFLKQIEQAQNATAVHVRRTDTVTNNPTFSNISEKPYYHAATKKMNELVNEPHYFIFSDDPEWVRENINFGPHTTYVSGSTKDYEEMYLMSRCKNFIIANSTFSWWGAWLGEKRNSIVIAPRIWTNINQDWFKDTVPDRWLRV